MAVYAKDGTQLNVVYATGGAALSAAYDLSGNEIFQDSPQPITLKVMEYNCGGWYIGSGTNVPSASDGTYYALQNGMISRQDADILCICEYWSTFSKAGRQAATMLGQYYQYIHEQDGTAKYSGRCICSKYPITSYTPHTFTGDSDGRYYDDAVISINGESIHVLVTHLHPSDVPTKIAQATELCNYVKTLSEKFIICGDFNSTLYDPFSSTNAAIYNQFLEAGCTLANDGAFGIFPTACNSTDWANDKFAIDNIIASSGISIDSVGTDLTKTTDGINDTIDHVPLYAEVTIS